MHAARLSARRLTRSRARAGWQVKSLQDEIERLKKLAHPNIVQFVDVITTPLYMHLVMECPSLRMPSLRNSPRHYASARPAHPDIPPRFAGHGRQSWRAARLRPWSTTLEASPNRSPPSTSHSAAPYVAHAHMPLAATGADRLRACTDGGALSWQPGPRVLAPHERHSSQHQRSVRRRARGLHGRSLNCDRCGRRTARTGANVLITRTGQVKLAGSSATLHAASEPNRCLTSSPAPLPRARAIARTQTLDFWAVRSSR